MSRSFLRWLRRHQPSFILYKPGKVWHKLHGFPRREEASNHVAGMPQVNLCVWVEMGFHRSVDGNDDCVGMGSKFGRNADGGLP